MRLLLVAVAVTALGCGANLAPRPLDARGDTNGRMFDFVSAKPDGSEWTVRVRGDSMWVAYADGSEAKELDAVTLSSKEARRLWTLIEDAAIYDREEGEPDEEVGSVLLRLREPTEDGEHDLVSAWVPRDTDDETVIDLASYLIDLIEKHHQIAPAL